MITPAAVDLFRRANAIEEAGLEETWQDEGGRQREYLDLSTALHAELRFQIWETSPLSVDDDGGDTADDHGSGPRR